MDDVVVFLKRSLSRRDAETIIKQLIFDGAFVWSQHSKKRMKERDITMSQVINCLSKGRVVEDPFFSYIDGGGYETAVEKNTAGERLRVPVCIKLNKKLLIITVY